MEINELLKFFRLKKEMTQKQVADAINVDKTTYAHYELGRRIPNAKTWVQLSNVLGFPVFPAQIKIVYPDGLLDKFENCIKTCGEPTGDYQKNNNNFIAISNCLDEIYKVNEEAMDTRDLPLDKLLGPSVEMPCTVMNVILDARAEKLIEKATQCMKFIMLDNQKII